MDRIILYIYKARPALHTDLPEVHEKVRILSVRKGIPTPSIYSTELPLPGSFIIGRNRDNTSLVIPKRAIDIMKIEELEAMLGYNIVQINDDISLRTLAALVTGLMTMAASIVRWGAVFTGFGDYDDPAPKLFGFFVMGLVAPPAATMIHLVSTRDYDIEFVSLYVNPAALVSAIERLEANNVGGYPSFGFLSLVDPVYENFFEYLFNSHLSKDTRIKNLSG